MRGDLYCSWIASIGSVSLHAALGLPYGIFWRYCGSSSACIVESLIKGHVLYDMLNRYTVVRFVLASCSMNLCQSGVLYLAYLILSGIAVEHVCELYACFIGEVLQREVSSRVNQRVGVYVSRSASRCRNPQVTIWINRISAS